MFGRCVVMGWVLCAVVGCGGRMGDDDGEGGRGAVPDAGAGGQGPTGGVASGGRAGAAGAGGSGVGGAYVDPGCPDIEPPPALFECDPLAAVSGCGAGLACYPFVEHPFGRGCGVATFGAMCAPSGAGVQGDTCGDGVSRCAPQHLCVIGSRAGRRCAQICVFAGPDECPDGLVCAETDVENYGVCT